MRSAKCIPAILKTVDTNPDLIADEAALEAAMEEALSFLELILGDAAESAKAEPIPDWLRG
jgi:hypothetical protein